MFNSVFSKTLYTLRWQILGWGVGVSIITLITVSVFDSLAQSDFENIVTTIPESLRGFVGNADNYKSIEGFLAQQVFGLKIVMFVIVMSILLFLGISASEEDDGRLHTLISLPLSRTKIYFQKWLAILLAIALVCLLMAGATYLGLFMINKTIDSTHMAASLMSLWLLATSYGMVGYGIAMLTGKKGLSIAITSAYAVFGIIMTSLATSVDQLKELDKLSLLHYYNNPQIMQHGLNMEHTLILVGAIAVLTFIGWLGFARRSVGV